MIHPSGENSVGSPSHHASQNLPPLGAHRITGVERYLWRPPVQIPVQSQSRLISTSSARAPQRMQTPKYLWATISHLIHPHDYVFSFYGVGISLAATCLCCLLTLVHTSGKSPAPFSLHTPPITLPIRFPLNCSPPGQTKPVASASPRVLCAPTP